MVEKLKKYSIKFGINDENTWGLTFVSKSHRLKSMVPDLRLNLLYDLKLFILK